MGRLCLVPFEVDDNGDRLSSVNQSKSAGFSFRTTCC